MSEKACYVNSTGTLLSFSACEVVEDRRVYDSGVTRFPIEVSKRWHSVRAHCIRTRICQASEQAAISKYLEHFEISAGSHVYSEGCLHRTVMCTCNYVCMWARHYTVIWRTGDFGVNIWVVFFPPHSCSSNIGDRRDILKCLHVLEHWINKYTY